MSETRQEECLCNNLPHRAHEEITRLPEDRRQGIADLREELDSLRVTLRREHDRTNSAQQRADDYEGEIERLREELKLRRKETRYLAGTVARLREALRMESANVGRLQIELDATRKAKQENDERFQLQAAHWREAAERNGVARLRAELERTQNKSADAHAPIERVRAVLDSDDDMIGLDHVRQALEGEQS